MLGDQSTKSWKAEHLTFGVVGLDQPVAVEKDALSSIEFDLLLLIPRVRHKPQGHPPGPKLLGIVPTPEVGQVMTGVGVAQATPLGVEDGVEAGHERVGWYVGKKRLVDPLEHLPKRGESNARETALSIPQVVDMTSA